MSNKLFCHLQVSDRFTVEVKCYQHFDVIFFFLSIEVPRTNNLIMIKTSVIYFYTNNLYIYHVKPSSQDMSPLKNFSKLLLSP